jgi:serine protease Do
LARSARLADAREEAVVKAVAFVVVTLMMIPAMEAQTRERDVRAGLFPQLGGGATIGASVRELAADEMSRAKLDPPGGVYVTDVREGSPAARAGVRSGDVIVAFDGERIRGVRHFSRLVLETPPGRAVSSDIMRGGARQTLTITPEATEGLAGLLPEIQREIERGMRRLPPDLPVPAVRGTRARLGVTLTPLTDQLASYFGVKEGVLVSAVAADSPAARAGIRAGDVLTVVDGRPVRTPADVSASARAAAPGATLDVRLMRDGKEMSVTVAIPGDQPTPAREIAI